jgi:hypothetical protein
LFIQIQAIIYDYIGDDETCSLCYESFTVLNKKQSNVKNGIRNLGPLCSLCYNYFVSSEGIQDSVDFFNALNVSKGTIHAGNNVTRGI